MLVESQLVGYLLQDIFGEVKKLPSEVSSITTIHSKQPIASIAIICQVLRLQSRIVKHAPALLAVIFKKNMSNNREAPLRPEDILLPRHFHSQAEVT